MLFDAHGRPVQENLGDSSGQKEHHEIATQSSKDQAHYEGNEPPQRSIGDYAAINSQTNKSESYEEKNYRLQKRGLVVQILLCTFTALAFGAAAYYAFIARQQVDFMQRQFAETQRPWISFRIPEVERFWCNGDCFVALRCELDALGNSPAMRVTSELVGIADQRALHRETVPDEIKAICDKVDLLSYIFNSPSTPQFPNTVLPSDKVVREEHVMISRLDIKDALKFIKAPISPMILGCVAYSDGFSSQRHHATLGLQISPIAENMLFGFDPADTKSFASPELRVRYIPGAAYAN